MAGKGKSRKNRVRRFYILDNESVEVGQLLDGRSGREFEVLLLEFASLGVLVTEDEVNLRGERSIRDSTRRRDFTRTLVPGQVRSGPNMTTHGVVSENSFPLVWKPSSRSLR